jgi:hypothetical protein
VIVFESDRRDKLIEWINSTQEDLPLATARRGEQIEIRWRDADNRLDDEEVRGNRNGGDYPREPEPLRILVPAKHSAVKKDWRWRQLIDQARVRPVA